ncbi:hypothetical protein QMZ92_32500 [Streptomyces sp. HNM0645]|uniref:hypothetical protein n=1 Tax=Streptomyces sp. HNM0645 TaxID=2782343 RepID=UPI0024B76489|nr:hypothetical protein [Streptomyces sp. HNM0645]MDI9888946.1 hypothetical protein [Streptomyces sp. HNM0645]
MQTDGPPDGVPGRTRGPRVAELALCGVLATALLLSAVEAIAQPAAPWWPFVWQNAWTLSAVTLGCWAVLRITEKADARDAERRDGTPPQHGPASQDRDDEPPSQCSGP